MAAAALRRGRKPRYLPLPGVLLNLAQRAIAARVSRRVSSDSTASTTHRIPAPQPVEPLVVLILLPVLIGVASEVYFRDTTRASLAATIVAPTVVYFCLITLDPGGTWNWLATLLVSPLAIALALAAVMACFGRTRVRRRPRRNGA
jgi:hypothetical protein